MHHLENELNYSKMSLANIESASDCVCKTFLLNEPLATHLRMVEENFKPFIDQLLTHALQDDLSWVASDQKTGKVIGAFIATDLANDFQPTNVDPKLASVFKLLEGLWAPFAHETHVPKGLVAHAYMGAVLPEYQRSGIINTMYAIAYKNGWERGYRKAMGEVTSVYSLNLLRKNPNVKELNSIAYADYEQDGVKIFEGMKIHEQCVLFSAPIEAMLPPEVMQPSANRKNFDVTVIDQVRHN